MTAKERTKLAAPVVGVIVGILTTIFGPKIGAVSVSQIGGYLTVLLAGVLAVVHGPKVAHKVKHRHKKPKKPPKPTSTIVMYDTITLSDVPHDPPAVAGYVGGSWPTYSQLARDFPRAKRLSIAVNASENAEALDVEPGDAVAAQAGGWVKKMHGLGVKRPCIYTSLSNVSAVMASIRAAGVPRSAVRVWVAHWTFRAHICNPTSCGCPVTADATQWTDRSAGRNLDESLCQPDFFS